MDSNSSLKNGPGFDVNVKMETFNDQLKNLEFHGEWTTQQIKIYMHKYEIET